MAKKGKKNPKTGTIPKEKNPKTGTTPKEKKKVTQKGSVAAKDVPSVAAVRVCPHLETGINLEKLSVKFNELETPIKCDDCRKGKGKPIWMCLECGHLSCGGVGLPSTPNTHATRHARGNRHPLAIKFENHQLRYCFICDMVIRAGKSEDGAEERDVFHEVVKMMKVKTDAPPVLDAEDIWFGKGGVLENSSAVGGKAGYTVKGLSNLGNTCFFNSVMQNLLALSSLREYFHNLDGSFGPLSASLKKLVSEVDAEYGMRNVVSPKMFFGSVCAKAPQFKGYQQQDSHELLRCLLDGLSTEELKARKLDGSWKEGGKSNPVFVEAMFGGQLSSTVTCLDCKHSSLVYEPFLDLSLSVPTKKPTSRKTQDTVRARKPKAPPKRIYRARPKISRDSDTSLSASTVGPSSCAVQSSETVPEQKAISSGDAVGSDTEIVTNGKIFVTENLSSATPAESSQTIESVTTTTENMSWLDVLGADTNEYSQIDPDLSSDLECSKGNVSYEGPWLDEHEQVRSINDEAIDMQVNEKIELDDYVVEDAVQSEVEALALPPFSQGLYYGPWPENFSAEKVHDSEIRDAVQSEVEGLEFHSLHFAQDCSYGPWPEKFSEEETPLLAQDSQDIITNSEVPKADIEFPSSVPDPEYDSCVGVGNLFDEPEVAGPSLNLSNIKGYSSDSEPDEVDDSNSPVSVESCLSLFTKAERLCKKEHAWKCENCSKILQQKISLKKKLQNSGSGHVGNRNADTTASGTSHLPSLQGILSGSSEAAPLCNGSVRGEMVETSDDNVMSHEEKTEGGKTHGNQIACISAKLEHGLKLASGSSAEDATSSTLDNNYKNCEGCNVEQRYGGFSDGGVQEVVAQTENLSLESEGEEDQKKNEKIVKVERDATKRILINRAPPILTIHLKRFSQDGRGRLSKLNGHVEFNHTIDLKPFVDKSCVDRDDCKYSLVGLVEHSGTMRGGHYVAYVRGGAKNARGDDVWYHASDAFVREASLQEVLRAEAYILFYERI